MKTLTINGLVFTDQPPTKEGWWLWVYEHKERVQVGKIEPDMIKTGLIANYGGFWHELIPRGVFAEEVEKAYREAQNVYASFESLDINTWPESRAKLVAEGKESSI
jgi:hypothetical protein